MNLMDLFVKISVDDQASSQVETIGGKLKSGLATAAKVGAAAVAAAGTAVVAIGKQAIDQYAEYEQLVGGAELMFGDAYDFVAEKAKNAYSTVQMSQNDYLRQVNGFATGLKTALGGNAQAAAELADKIVNAEADVVAATGASQEMVQNAFNGIMRSNYVMLDNLQLGITPTKEGFQEVIDKVNEWNAANGKATNYVIDNLADAQSALVDYIEMQGLQGYAANEAADTIQGSLASMKSAWQNLLTGVADDNANFEELVNNFVDSLVGVGENIIPRINTVIQGLTQLITQASQNIIPLAVETILQNLPSIVAAGMDMVMAIVNGILDNIDLLIDCTLDIVDVVVDKLIENLPKLIDGGVSLMIALAEGLVEAIPQLIEKVPVIITKLIEAYVNNAPKMIEASLKIIVALAEGLIKSIPELIKAIPQIVTAIVNGFKNYMSQIKDIGKNIVNGVWEGIKSMASWITGKVKSFFSGIVDSVKGVLGIRSPSRVFAGIGENMALGLSDGWDSEYNKIKRNITNGLDFGTATIDAKATMSGKLQNALTNIGNIGGDINIVVQSVLDGKIIGETAYKYNRQMQRAMGV